ncbi:MAG: hypothetical protein AAB444_00930 [Patescibacteria group bacterium]
MPKKKQNPIGVGKYKICVSGAAAGICLDISKDKAREVGRQIIEQGAILTTGATTGIPYESSKGAKEAGGLVVGFSPASSPKEHVKKYRLPLSYLDIVVYTGFGYAGRNLLLTRASDAVIVVCGRMGTLNEFTIAFEDQKVIGVLLESGGTADEIPHILEKARKTIKGNVIYGRTPKEIVSKVLAAIKEEDRNNGKSIYYA